MDGILKKNRFENAASLDSQRECVQFFVSMLQSHKTINR